MAKVIALYLPQYHPTPHNNEWWGQGFTEWTNVCKARPLFKNHDQPHVPADLGFYDLRYPEIKEQQAALAKKYGIYGFCYYHYRFGPGKRELETPFNQVLESGQPDFPFMLCWANESWNAKFWNKDGSCKQTLLMEQTYGDRKDYEDYFYEVLPAFKDPRYIKIHGKPAFMVYKPLDVADFELFRTTWNELAVQNGLDGIYLMGFSLFTTRDYDKIKALKVDAIEAARVRDCWIYKKPLQRACSMVYRTVFRKPFICKYKRAITYLKNDFDRKNDIYPTIVPNWDHTPRSGLGGTVYTDVTPELFRKHVDDIFDEVSGRDEEDQIIFLKSWNEWGEGNYVEPDLKFGTTFLEIISDKLKQGDK